MRKARIAVWNLERPPKLSAATRKAQIEKMVRTDADLWILSESATTTAIPGYHDCHSARAAGYHQVDECAASVLSRWPLGARIETFAPTFAVCVEIPETPLGPLVVYASLIPYAGYKGPDGKSGYWVEHRKSIEAHAKDWRAIRCMERYRNHYFIAGGDYNQRLDDAIWYGNSESKALLQQGLKEAGLECLTALDFGASHQLSRGNIDHLCVSEGLRSCVRSVTPWEGTEDVKMSDHNGVLVELS